MDNMTLYFILVGFVVLLIISIIALYITLGGKFNMPTNEQILHTTIFISVAVIGSIITVIGARSYNDEKHNEFLLQLQLRVEFNIGLIKFSMEPDVQAEYFDWVKQNQKELKRKFEKK